MSVSSVSFSHQKIQISREFVIIFLKVFYSPLLPHKKLRPLLLLLLSINATKPSVGSVCNLHPLAGRENGFLFLLLLLLKKGEFFRE